MMPAGDAMDMWEDYDTRTIRRDLAAQRYGFRNWDHMIDDADTAIRDGGDAAARRVGSMLLGAYRIVDGRRGGAGNVDSTP